MICYIPIGEYEKIIPPVEKSIREQGVIIEFSRFGKKPKDNRERIENIAENRRNIMKRAAQCEGEYFIMNDRGIYHTRDDNFLRMRLFLDDNPEWIGVSLFPGKRTNRIDKGHIDFSCVMLRKIPGMENFKVGNSCECKAFSTHVRDMGWKYGYLSREGDGIKTVKSGVNNG